jgi:tetratricopeptide (TPR) repeat protein/tRNA A-37 threonylcarbamoyl transferase component Bud32
MDELDLFAAAIAITDPVKRDELLEQQCAGQPELRKRILQLLAVHFQTNPALDQPGRGEYQTHTATGAGAESTTDAPLEAVGAEGSIVAGRYKLLQQIGEGGMGTVWMADQTEPVKRRVAVKLIRADRWQSKAILARFEAERQAIALMNHPHIAKMLDAGTTEAGAPYFVMDLVKGTPLTDFCDAHRLSVPDRLDLFLRICSAVQHAHQKGIIHRDLKPSNILVESHDGKPVPKVIDFGLAKAATGLQLSERTLFTAFGSVIFTPQYMAPEQATASAVDVDTRADIYALGVVLYELLTGTTPITRESLRQAAVDEMLRLVREQEAPMPSSRLKTSESTPNIAANRQTEPAKLGRFVRGDLDWIALKALAKERDRRYETSSGFARDIERFLKHQPVAAGPPTAAYRLRKFVRRNRGRVIAASLVLAALLAGIAGTSFGLLRARRALAREAAQRKLAQDKEREAQSEKRKAIEFRDKALDALRATTGPDVEKLIGAKNELGANEKAYLEAIAARWLKFAQQEGTDEQTRAIQAEGHIGVGLLWARLGRTEEARTELEQAKAIHEKLAAEFPTAHGYREALASSHHDLGIVLEKLGRWAEAESHFGKALGLREKLAAEFPNAPVLRDKLAHSHSSLGGILGRLGRSVEAERHHRQALALKEKLAAEFPNVSGYRDSLAMGYNNLGILLDDLGRRSEAEKEHLQALAIWQKLAAEFPMVRDYQEVLAASHYNLANLLNDQRRLAEAEAHHRQGLVIAEKLAAEYPSSLVYRRALAQGHINLGNLLQFRGQIALAEESYRKGMVIAGKLATEFPTVPGYREDLAVGHNSLGALLHKAGQAALAESEFRQAVALRDKLAADFPAVLDYRKRSADSHRNLGKLLNAVGKPAETEREYRAELAIQEKRAADFPAVAEHRQALAHSHNDLGVLLESLGRLSESETEHHLALALRQNLVAELPAVTGYGLDLGVSYYNLGKLMSKKGQPGDALEWFQKAVDALRPVHEQEPGNTLAQQGLRNAYWSRAMAYLTLQKHGEALKDWHKAIELSPRNEQPGLRVMRAVSRVKAGQFAEAVAEIAELTKSASWKPGEWYNFACYYALASGNVAEQKQQYADRAMELLQTAVKAGWSDAALMKEDHDLDALRDRADFQKLIAKIEAQAKPK